MIDENTLTFVAIHELAHIMTKSIGHGDDFWNNMRYLLSVAIVTPAKQKYRNNTCAKKIKNQMRGPNHNIYNYENYSEKSSAYCGTNITTTPCNDDKCKT